jgi:hypothetical protein
VRGAHRRAISRIGISILALVASREARAQESPDQAKAACIEAAESAQRLRGAGHLLEARTKLHQCAAEACPALIRNDCTTWLAQVVNATPSVVFVAEVGGESAIDVSVSLDGKRLTEQLDGNPIEVDPGIHIFVFEHTGLAPIEKRVVVAQHETGKILSVAWPAPSRPRAIRTEAPPPTSTPSLGRALGWSAVGLAAAGIVVGSVAGILTFNASSSAQAACPSNVCKAGGLADIDRAQTDATVADISFAVGIAAALVGGYLVLRHEPQAQSAVRLMFGPKLASHEAGAWLGAQFE